MSDFWKDAGAVLGTVAPVLATAVGGPLAGVATRAIVGALGLADDSTEQQIAAAVSNATPDQLLALKRADQDFAAKMKELDIDILRVDAGDRANARDMAIRTNIWPQCLLTAFFCLAFGVALSMMLSGLALFPKEYELTVGTLLGALISEMKAASQFWLGSSSGSSKKDETIKALTR